MHSTIYLSGAHRTGKSYLASVSAHCLSIDFKEANLSAVYSQLNTSPQDTLTPSVYMPIQELMLARMNSTYIKPAKIVDRSHVDLAAYAIYHVRNSPELDSWLKNYVERCLSSIDKDAVIVSVPISALTIEDAVKSFTKDSAQEIQDIIQGLYLHPLLKAKVVHIPVETTKIYERVQVIDDILQEQKSTNKVSNVSTSDSPSEATKLLDILAHASNLPTTGRKP